MLNNHKMIGRKIYGVLLLTLLTVTTLLSDVVFSEDFESGDFSNWQVVNGTQPNQWYVGEAGAQAGNGGAFISLDGEEAHYNVNESNSTVYFYRDIMIPDGTVMMKLAFDWKCGGESSYDYGRVLWVDTDTELTAGGTIIENGYLGDDKYLSVQEEFGRIFLDIPIIETGIEKRLVFAWNNDHSLGNWESFCVDNIEVTNLTADDPPNTISVIAPEHEETGLMHNVELKWRQAAGADSYILYFGTDGDGTTNPTSIIDAQDLGADTTYACTNLTWDTDYYWTVVAVNENGESENNHINKFTTRSNPIQIAPISEDFSDFPPTDWTQARGELDDVTEFTDDESFWAEDGFGNVTSVGAAKIEYYRYRNEWFISPYVDLGDGSQIFKLEFDLALTPYSGSGWAEFRDDDRFVVLVKEMDQENWSSAGILNEWNSENDMSNTGQHEIVSLAGYTGVIQVAFYAEKNEIGGDYQAYIDNFEISEAIGEPLIEVTSDDIEFGEVAVDYTAERTISIRNSGGSTLNITGIDCPEYITSDYPELVVATADAEITFTYAPTTASEITGEIVIHSNSASGDTSVVVSGLCYAPVQGELIDNPFEITFDGTNQTFTGATRDFHDMYDLPVLDGKDVVYKITTDQDYIFTASLLESSYDTKMAIYEDHSDQEGWIPGELNYLYYNDDDHTVDRYSSRPILRDEKYRVSQSRIQDVELRAGTYFIIVDGYNGAAGDYSLEVSGTPTSLVSISGDVTNDDNDTLMVDVEVSFGDYDVETDENGHFELSSVIPGTYEVVARYSQFYTYRDSVNVSGESLDYDFSMIPYHYGVIKGKITNSETNEPVADAPIKFGLSRTFRTDSLGNYRAEHMLLDSYSVNVAAAYHYEYNAPEYIVLDSDSMVYNVELDPFHWGDVTGLVTNEETNAPIIGANVHLGENTTVTDSIGHYRFSHILYDTFETFYAFAGNYDSKYIEGGLVLDQDEITYDIALVPHPDTDNLPSSANKICGEIDHQLHSIYPQDDVDWFVFFAPDSTELTLIGERFGSSNVDIQFFLYGPYENHEADVDSLNHAAMDDDSHGSTQPELVYTTDGAGYYFLRVAYFDNDPEEEETRAASTGDYTLTVNGDVSFYKPPTNLTAEVEAFDVNLSWTAPVRNLEQLSKSRNSRTYSREITAFKIFRDHELIGNTTNDVTTYRDTLLPAGTYSYYVVATNDSIDDSRPSDSVVVVIAPMNPPYGLELDTDENDVTLTWNFSADLNDTRSASRRKEKSVRNTREVTGFRIYRNNEFLVDVAGTDELTYLDEDLAEGDYEYYLTALYFGEYESNRSNVEDVHIDPVVSNEDVNIPKVTSLDGNYPNPFNPTTSISYGLHENSKVNIVIYNAKGQRVTTLVNEDKKAGKYTIIWNGNDDNNHDVSSGVYFYKMQTKSYSKINKMLLMK